MCSLTYQNSYQSVVYADYKQVRCLISQIVRTPGGSTFRVFGLIKIEKQELALPRQSGCNNVLCETLFIDKTLIVIYE